MNRLHQFARSDYGIDIVKKKKKNLCLGTSLPKKGELGNPLKAAKGGYLGLWSPEVPLLQCALSSQRK